MKKVAMILSILILFVANSFAQWKVNNYVDSFGDTTSQKYIQLFVPEKGAFSNSATSGSELIVAIALEPSKSNEIPTVNIRLFEYGRGPEVGLGDGEIATLKEKLKEYVGKFDEYSTSMTSKIMETISSLTLERMTVENELLIVGSAEERTKSVIAAFNKLPNKLESLNDADYRKLYSRAFVKNKDDILLIVGNKDVSKLNLSTKGELDVEIPYTVRITTYKLRLSVYINI